MDAAKISVGYGWSTQRLTEELAMRFMDIRKRVYKFPKWPKKAELVAYHYNFRYRFRGYSIRKVVTDDKTALSTHSLITKSRQTWLSRWCEPSNEHASSL